MLQAGIHVRLFPHGLLIAVRVDATSDFEFLTIFGAKMYEFLPKLIKKMFFGKMLYLKGSLYIIHHLFSICITKDVIGHFSLYITLKLESMSNIKL